MAAGRVVRMLLGVALAASMSLMSGCRRVSTADAPVTPTTWQATALQYMGDVSAATKAADDVVAALHATTTVLPDGTTAPVIDDALYGKVHGGLVQVSTIGLAIDQLLAESASAQTVAARVQSLSDLVQTLIASGQAGIKNPLSQQRYAAYVGAIAAALQVVLSKITTLSAESRFPAGMTTREMAVRDAGDRNGSAGWSAVAGGVDTRGREAVRALCQAAARGHGDAVGGAAGEGRCVVPGSDRSSVMESVWRT